MRPACFLWVRKHWFRESMPDAKQKYTNSIPLLFNGFCKYRDTFVFLDISCLQLLHNASGITKAVLSAGFKFAKCFVLFGPLCQPGTCVAWKVSFPPSNESLMSMLLAVNCMKLSGFRSVRTTVPFISFKNRLYLALVKGPTTAVFLYWFFGLAYYIPARADKGDREGIPHTHPIP